MRKNTVVFSMILSLLLLYSCANKETGAAAGPHATVLMRDGSQYSGTVTSSSPTELTLAADDNTTRTVAMKDVKSVEYDEAPRSRGTGRLAGGCG